MPLFDFDGTLVDSDVALTAPWHALGVDPDLVPLGLPLVEACERAGVTVEAYLAHYDPTAALPFAGVAELLAGLDRWGLASNKERASGRRELERLGWHARGGAVLGRLRRPREGAGARCSTPWTSTPTASCSSATPATTAPARAPSALRFALAGWNPRARAGAEAGDLVLDRPEDVLDLLDARTRTRSSRTA